MIISEDGRHDMTALRQGRTLEQYLEDMWQRRAVEQPDRVTADPYANKASWSWPRAGADISRALKIVPQMAEVRTKKIGAK